MFNLLRPIQLLIIKCAVIIGGVLVILFKARQSGREVEKHKAMRDTLKGVQIRDKIENNIIIANDDKYNKLREKWTKE